MKRTAIKLLTWSTLWISVLLTSPVKAQPPLREQIDQLIAAQAGGVISARASDAEFLRRAYLDLAGTIPAADEARNFLNDEDPGKRAKIIDRLLSSPDYARRMQQAFTVMWLERRSGTAITDQEWNEYLRESFAANKPWDQFVRELVAADGRDEKTRSAIRFFVDGGRQDHHLMTQDVARLFLGRNIQCAQCHDHPNVDDYTQADYFGLYAYLNQSKLHADEKEKKPFLVEGVVTGKIDFQSVFAANDKHATGPRLPGRTEIEIPAFAQGEEFAEPARDGLPGMPKFRPRVLLSGELTASDNQLFVRNSVNRVWFLMMGTGLVHPLDMMHSGNPPSHPELLESLAAEFVGHSFDVKYLLREIALSESYQRGSLLPDGVDPQGVSPRKFQVAVPKPLSAEQMLWSGLQATGNLEALLQAPTPVKSAFTYNDYVNGRIPDIPNNLRDTMVLFTAVFGNPPGEAEVEFGPSAEQSLFLSNERLVQHWLKPREGNLVARLVGLGEANQVAEELYLSVLTRLPEEAEKIEVASYLEKHKERRQDALADLTWALLASAEFRLNH